MSIPMNRFILLLISLLLPNLLQAQIPPKRYSARLGLDLTSLDAPDARAPRYVARLARHVRNDRFMIAAEAGYMRVVTANYPFNAIDPGPNRRERLTADATVLVDLLPHSRHALRLGGGLSVWYRRDDIYRGAATIGQDSFAISRRLQRGVTSGWHLATEYEWQFAERWSVDARLRVANLQEAGISSALGTGISYGF